MKDLVEKYVRQDEEDLFSLEYIVPMPRELDIAYDSYLHADMVMYLTEGMSRRLTPEQECFINFDENGKAPLSSDFRYTVLKICNEIKEDEKASHIQRGGIIVRNIKKYGCPTAYHWHLENWGTKTDVWDVSIEDKDTIRFTCPSGPPSEALVVLSKMCPKDNVTCEWSCNFAEGCFVLLDGECISSTEDYYSPYDEDDADD